MSNLTLEHNLVRPLGAPRTEPGHHVVVYREGGEGRSFYQALPRGEPFRPRLLDRLFGSFVGYAVNAGSGLRHRFNDQLETGTGDRHDVFKVHVTLVYRVAAPEALVDRLSDDPLGSLESEVRNVFRRRTSQLPYEDLVDRGFDLESFLLGGGGRHDEAEADVLDRFRALAQGFGIELEGVEVTRTYSARKTDSASRVVGAGYDTAANVAEVRGLQFVEAARIQGENELEELRGQRRKLEAQTRRQIDVLDSVAGGLKEIVRNVSQDTRNVTEVRKLLGELTRARADFDALVAPPTPALPSARAALGAAAGGGVLGRELERLLEVTAGLDLERADRAGLEGRLLHVVAEVRLASDSGGERLEEHASELHRYSDTIGLQAAVSTEEQRRYLVRFRDPETIRRELAALAVVSQSGDTETQ